MLNEIGHFFHRLGNNLINPVVVDSVRSWFATLSGVAATSFAFAIVLLQYYSVAGPSPGFMLTALVLTHLEAILCLFYLQRLTLESVKGKIGVVELEMETTNERNEPVQQTVRATSYGLGPETGAGGETGPKED